MLDAGNVRPNGGPGRESAAHYAACAGILNAGLRCISMGLLPVPWVVSAAGEGGALTTEAEHGQGDEGLGAVESVCHAGDEPYLGID
jgi:hypothetical protein